VKLLSDTWFLIARQARNLLREPIWIALLLIQPMVWLVLYSQLFTKLPTLGGFGTTSYITFLMPGIVVMNAFFGATWSGMSMIDDLDRKVVERFLATPASRLAIVLSQIVRSAITAAIQAVIILVVALVLGARVHSGFVGWLTIILAAVQHGTGRAAAFGVPRNLAQVPLGPKGTPFKEPINALYGRSGGGETGARNLKQAVSALLGVRVDYYALVNLVGFADLVDALGGVEILVKERLHDEVTRAAWGEPKPKIDVVPGHTYRFYGREALAYVRSRKDSSDYTRMARQRCFLSAMADQLDPVRAIRNFGSLAKTIESNVHTDIPLNRLPSLVRLVSSVDSRKTLTVTFGFDYFFGRQKSGNYPVPALGRIRSTVRRAILTPELLEQTGKAKTATQAC